MSLEDLRHFQRLLTVGGERGASSGERAALALARCVERHLARLDLSAIRGLMEWMDYCEHKPCEASDWLESHGGTDREGQSCR
jgi:hypothetical protein